MNHVRIDDTDRKILQLLQSDASLSHAAIAERVGASPTSCWRRIRLLEDAGVLTGHVRLVDPARIGRGVSVMLQVRLKSHSIVAREDFESFVHQRPEIMECYSMSGEWDYHLRIVVAGVDDYQRFLMSQMLSHPNVSTTASHFALGMIKYVTSLPV